MTLTTDLHPGFYDLRVTVDTGSSEPTKGICTFGWKPEEMAIPENRPADLIDFWKKALATFETIPLAPRMEGEQRIFKGKEIDEYNVASACLPPNYDPEGCRYEEVESYKISFAGPDGGRVYGWLAKPVGPGPFPAMLVLPGAGFAPRPRPLEHARHGYIALDIQIHGQDVDLVKYDRLPGYNDQQVYDPPEAFYFRNVYLRAQRAVEYLCVLPDADASRLVAVGGSQGGRLAIVVAALDQRVRAIVPCITNSSNEPERRRVEQLNRHANDDKEVAAASTDDLRSHCWTYYDPMNFAPDVTCPVFMNAGLIDPISPPYSVWSAYLRLASRDRQIIPLPGLGHDWSADFDRRAWRWLDEKLQEVKSP